MTDAPTIADVPAESRFLFRSVQGDAELVYHRNGSRLVLVHTEVPDALGGQGIGGRLVRAALDMAAREGLTVVPWCPFARHWLEEHPDEAARVTVDWDSAPPR